MRCFYRDCGCHVVPCTFSLFWPELRSSSSRPVYPLYFFSTAVIRWLVRAPGLQAGFDAGPVITHDPEFCAECTMRDPGPRAESGASCGIQCGAGASYGIRCSTWDPGLSTTSQIPCGIQCGIMVFNVGARTSNVIPTSVRDPTREHRCRAGPGIPCGRQCGILDPVSDPESRPSSNAW